VEKVQVVLVDELHQHIIINQDHQLVEVQAVDLMQVQMYQPKK
jgi:hypothetical protein